MELWVSTGLLVSILTVLLHIVNGFSIRGHPGNNQEQQETAWPTDVDRIRNLAGRIQFEEFAQHNSQGNKQNLQQPVLSPDESILYDAFAALREKRDDLKRSIAPFLTSNGNDDYANNDEDGVAGVNDNTDDEGVDNDNDGIDLIATFSYPQNVMAKLDNLPLSTKFGLQTVPRKRQQGWYVQYGKRSPINDISKDTMGAPDPMDYSGVESTLDTSKPLHSAQSADEHNAEPQKLRLNMELRRHLEQLENDLKISNIAYDIVKSFIDDKSKDILQPHSSVKRQQGWYTQYGKRNSERINGSFS